jgi:hypothetical protein
MSPPAIWLRWAPLRRVRLGDRVELARPASHGLEAEAGDPLTARRWITAFGVAPGTVIAIQPTVRKTPSFSPCSANVGTLRQRVDALVTGDSDGLELAGLDHGLCLRHAQSPSAPAHRSSAGWCWVGCVKQTGAALE